MSADLLIDDRLGRIDAQTVELPAARRMQTARGVIASEILILVRLETVQGVFGHSYVRCYTPTPAKALRALIEASGALAMGLRADPESIRAALEAEFALVGHKGLVAMAISAIDMAIWDAIAVAHKKPLRQLLGRDGALPRPYLALASMNGLDAAREAEKALQAGFAGVKFKAGRHEAKDDVEALRAIRSAIGPSAALMLDYNQKLALDDALGRLADLESFDLEWIEEPLDTDHHRGYAVLRERSPIALQLGENLYTAGEVRDCLPGADVIALDLGRIGGISGWLSAEGVIRERRPLSNHAYCEVSAQLLPSEGPRQWVEWGEQAHPLLLEPPSIRSGEICLPEAPGNGMAFSEASVQRLRSA